MPIEGQDKLEEYFILVQDVHDGVIIPKTPSIFAGIVSAVRGTGNTFNAIEGSLFKSVVDDEDENGIDNHAIVKNLVSVDNPSHGLPVCTLTDVRKLTKREFDILVAVPTNHERYDSLAQLQVACKAVAGDIVTVDNKKSEPKTGTLTYIGLLPCDKDKKGTYFGVKFEEEFAGDENSTVIASPGDKRHAFFPVNKISFLSDTKSCKKTDKAKGDVDRSSLKRNKGNGHTDKNTDSQKAITKPSTRQDIKDKFQNITKTKSNKNKNKRKSDEIDLPLQTRVICFIGDDGKPLAGTIVFIGNVANELMAGVKLDKANPHANGNMHNRKKLFDCEKGKGIIVRPDMLIKEDEYLGKTIEKPSYVTLQDGNDNLKRHELEKKEVKSVEEEQKELFRKIAEKKHVSLGMGLPGDHRSSQNVRSREESIEREIKSHDQHIQGIKNEIFKSSNNEFASLQNNQHFEHFDVPTHAKTISQDSYHIPNTDFKQSIAGQDAATQLPKLSVDEHRLQNKYQSLLQEGSMVEIVITSKKYYGVLKWKGLVERYPDVMFAGIELESSELTGCTNGTFLGEKRFDSPMNRAFFLKLHNCQPDSRFALQDAMEATQQVTSVKTNISIHGSILPVTKMNMDYLGREKGIQGHYNSCYMDSCLFAMFGYSHVFDVMLNRKYRKASDIKQYDTVQTILKEQIVNPLRKNGFVGHESVLELRKWLNELGDIGGFMTEEKDPEEFIVLLLEKVLKVDPFIKLHVNNREEDSHLYQIFFPKEQQNPLPSIQYLLEYSFLTSDLKLAEIPSVMILQMPRFGQEKLYKRIQVTATIDVSPLLVDKIHSCVICGQLANSHCPDCACLLGWDVVHTYLCDTCWYAVHKHQKRHNHKQPAKTLSSMSMSSSEQVELELFAVVCIEKSHYVSFVKCGTGENERWLFFDSMADRVGGEYGHNIPEVTLLEDLKYYLNGTPLEISELDKKSNELIMRVFDDASLCFYCNKNLTMYR